MGELGDYFRQLAQEQTAGTPAPVAAAQPPQPSMGDLFRSLAAQDSQSVPVAPQGPPSLQTTLTNRGGPMRWTEMTPQGQEYPGLPMPQPPLDLQGTLTNVGGPLRWVDPQSPQPAQPIQGGQQVAPLEMPPAGPPTPEMPGLAGPEQAPTLANLTPNEPMKLQDAEAIVKDATDIIFPQYVKALMGNDAGKIQWDKVEGQLRGNSGGLLDQLYQTTGGSAKGLRAAAMNLSIPLPDGGSRKLWQLLAAAGIERDRQKWHLHARARTDLRAVLAGRG